MRGTAAALLLAACGLGDRSTRCGDYVCPETYECVPTPAVCGPRHDVEACKGAQEFAACASSSGSGSCYQAICGPCDRDRAGCAYPGWNAMTPIDATVNAIWVGGISDAYVVGNQGAFAHYTGLGWDEPAPPPLGTDNLLSISGSGSTNVYALSNFNSTISSFDGTSWSSVPASPASFLVALHSPAPGVVVAVGRGGDVVQLAGGTWTTLYTASPQLVSVWSSDANDVFAVGTAGEVAYRTAGTSWTTAHPVTVNLRAVWGTSASDVFAVGGSGPTAPTIVHFDGTQWSAMTNVPSGSLNLQSVFGTSSSDVYAGADNGSLLHYDGTQWTSVTMLGSDVIAAIGGSGASDVFAVSANGAVWHYSGM